MPIIFTTFVQNWITMAAELQETLSRVLRKSSILVEKYQALLARHDESQALLSERESELERLRAEVERLTRENEFLRMAHSIGSSPEALARGRQMISKMVRDIDKCISQLNE